MRLKNIQKKIRNYLERKDVYISKERQYMIGHFNYILMGVMDFVPEGMSGEFRGGDKPKLTLTIDDINLGLEIRSRIKDQLEDRVDDKGHELLVYCCNASMGKELVTVVKNQEINILYPSDHIEYPSGIISRRHYDWVAHYNKTCKKVGREIAIAYCLFRSSQSQSF